MGPFLRPKIHLQTRAGECLRTLPELVNFHSLHNPDHLFCLQAEGEENAGGYLFIEIRYRQLQEAVIRCQKWLEDNLTETQPPVRNEDGTFTKASPVALFMESNIGMTVYLLSLIGLGIPVVLLSTRLSPLSVGHLLKGTSARAVLVSPRLRSVVSGALASGGVLKTGNDEDSYVSNIKIHDPATHDVFFAPSEGRSDGNIIHANHYISETDRKVLILHSSGSTGLPKPVYCSHRHLLGFACCHAFASDEIAQGLAISTSPLFHGFGIVPLCLSLGVGKPFCIPPSSTIPTGASVTTLVEDAKARALLTVPSILEEIALLPDQRGISALRGLDFVAFGGGLPKEAVAQKLFSAGVKLINHYGATETGPLTPFFQPSPGHDWHFFQLRTDIVKPLKVQLERLNEPDQQGPVFKLSMQPFGWIERYELQDMLISNPDGSKNSFTAAGRTDDLICLATGEKVRPTILEDLLQQNEGVRAATAFGNNQFELGVIVETTTSLRPSEHDAFKASIWPAIEEAGRRMDAHGRISSQTAIIIVDPMALPRSDKGTVLRKEVYKSFKKEILDVYDELDVNVFAPPINLNSPVSSIKSLITTHLPRFAVNDGWSEDKDLFELGMDSLQATHLRRLLAASLRATRIEAAGKDWLQLPTTISQDFVYRHPSATRMAEALVDGLSQANQMSDTAVFDRILHESSGRLSDDRHRITVLMTGSTGSLGSYLLCKLLESPGVDCVICLNRLSEENEYCRQRHALRVKGIELPEDAWSRVQILQTNTSDSHLGLDETQYQHLETVITHVIHTAWPMNFKLTLPSFSPAFHTLRNLIQLCVRIQMKRPWQRTRLLFISSISTTGNYPKLFSERIVPEEKIEDRQCALTIGYAQAKLMCEKIIERAAADYPQVEMGFVRVGQIAGALSGYWNANEHFVAIASSSKTLGVFPDLRGTLSWLPVDIAAAVLLELLFDAQPLRLVYHLENPVRQSWQDVTDILTEELGIPRCKRQPLDQWIDLVQSSANAGNPAKSLTSFIREEFKKMSCGGVILGTEVSRGRAITLRQMGTVSDTTIRAYVQYWRKVGVVSKTILPDGHPSVTPGV
ncbi:MAG: hypothetical protein Q9213_004013 [Squamulea squamosa]